MRLMINLRDKNIIEKLANLGLLVEGDSFRLRSVVYSNQELEDLIEELAKIAQSFSENTGDAFFVMFTLLRNEFWFTDEPLESNVAYSFFSRDDQCWRYRLDIDCLNILPVTRVVRTDLSLIGRQQRGISPAIENEWYNNRPDLRKLVKDPQA